MGPSLLLLALVMVNVPVYVGVGKLLFGRWHRFVEAVQTWVGTEMLSPGVTREAFQADMRLGLFVALSAGAVLTEYAVLTEWGLSIVTLA